jgi:hypothetical protein
VAGGVAVPERAVNEDGHPPAGPGNVRTSGRTPVVAAPPAGPCGPKRLSQRDLRTSVPAADGGHDAASLLGRSGVRHGRENSVAASQARARRRHPLVRSWGGSR